MRKVTIDGKDQYIAKKVLDVYSSMEKATNCGNQVSRQLKDDEYVEYLKSELK